MLINEIHTGIESLKLKKILIINFKNILIPKGIKYNNNNTFLIQNIIDTSIKQHWRLSTFTKFINICNVFIMRIELEKVKILDWYNLTLKCFGKNQELSINKDIIKNNEERVINIKKELTNAFIDFISKNDCI